MGIANLAFAAALAAATPAPMPGVVTHHSLSIEMAQEIARVSMLQCRKMGFRASIAVIDASGELKAFVRDDGTAPHTVNLAKAKAYTAVTLANRFKSTWEFATARSSTLGSPMTNIEGTVALGGGVPIRYRGEVIGGVGASGAVGGDNDEICVNAGIAAVAAQLK